MKKNPIIFIAMLIALAFTSCQMNNDDSVVTPPATEATSYAVVYNDETLKSGLTLAQAEAYIAQIQLIETTDYSINKTTGIITLTASGYEKVEPFIDNGNLPATSTTDGDDDGVVYAACKITLPNIDPETGKIVVTNKGKDGNSVVEKVYKDVTGAVYLGADEGDIIEIELRPDSTDVWDAYKYFEYENGLTVKNAFGEKINLTEVVKVCSYPVYTFTMPKTYVKVELPYGFEKPYSLTLDKPTNTTAKILRPSGAAVNTRNPGDKVYVMVVGDKIPRIEGLKRNGAYNYDDITEEVLATCYVSTTYCEIRVTIGTDSYFMANGDSWDYTGVHFYSFIMPRDSITIKL